MKTAWIKGEVREVLRNLVPALNPSCVYFTSEQSLGQSRFFN